MNLHSLFGCEYDSNFFEVCEMQMLYVELKIYAITLFVIA